VPFINGISIDSDSAQHYQDVNLALRVRVDGVDLCDEVTTSLNTLGMNKRFDVDEFGRSGALRIKFVGERLANLMQIQSMQAGYIEVELTHIGVRIARAQQPIWIMPARFWSFQPSVSTESAGLLGSLCDAPSPSR
jgi:hypothetical protein